ncbi:MAG: aldehyde ferredoxin oxidoreductase family protein [bacterium]|nr:aldehyde ferredoxin oxidoreductase family protein [bacterium]
MSGFHGRYLRIDLTRGTTETRVLPEDVPRRVLGGVGLGTWLLLHESQGGFDPLSPEAPLVFAFSPLVGTGLTTSAKFAVVAKSPLTGFVCDALSSSHFAIAGKRMGVDAIVVIGACDEPSEWVAGELRPARSWGRSAEETAAALAGEGRVAAIGVAGERCVRYATISADGRHAGRGGLGAVMGAKRLKALVVAGDVETPVADPASLERRAEGLRRRAAGPATAKYRELGTVGNLLAFDRVGALPTRNFQASHFEGAERLAAERWLGERSHRRAGCAHCTIGCEQRFATTRDGSPDVRIEYESQFALGPLVGVDDPDAVLRASARCDALGLDTISAGGTLAFAMECGERGLLEGGPRFGDDLLPWLDRIANREGLGDRLAEGSRRLALEIGGGAIDLAPQVKGLEMPGYEPRALQSLALGLAVSTRGADHNRSSAYEADFSETVDRLHGDERSVAAAVAAEDRAAVLDSLVLCKFVRSAFDDLFEESAEILRDVTGDAWDADAVHAVARRVVDLRRLGNEREGWRPEDDGLPKRFLDEPLASGPAVGARLPAARLEEMIRGYNGVRGYEEAGWVPRTRREALEAELGLDLRVGPGGGVDAG